MDATKITWTQNRELGTPKSLQGRGQYEASDLKLTQTKTSEVKLHNFFPQGHWSSRAEAELAKRKQVLSFAHLHIYSNAVTRGSKSRTKQP